MKLSINISSLLPTGKYSLEECARIFKNANFDCMDYSLEDMAYDDSALLGTDYKIRAQNIKQLINDAGLDINQTHTPFSFKNWDDKNHFDEIIYPRIIRSLEISAMLGADIAVVHPLHYLEYHGREEEIFELNMKYYRSLIPYCREFNIKVGVENMWRRDPRRRYIVDDTCSTIDEFIRYIDTLDSEYMVACLDVGHVGLPLGDFEAHDFVRALGHDRLKALHIHDNDYVGDLHLVPFIGKMNWLELAKSLGEINYTGDFTYELNKGFLQNVPDGFIQKAANYICDVGKYLIEEADKYRN